MGVKYKYIILGGIIILITKSGILLKEIIGKNWACKTMNGYEITGYGGHPIDVTHKIEEENCKCITQSLLVNPNPKKFTGEQLRVLRQQLPQWAGKNIDGFSENDRKELAGSLQQMNDSELLAKLEYCFSYFGKPASEEIPVYTIKIKSATAYCPNYAEEYTMYGKKDKFGFEPYPFKDKPDYPIIENKNWAENEFGKVDN